VSKGKKSIKMFALKYKVDNERETLSKVDWDIIMQLLTRYVLRTEPFEATKERLKERRNG